MKANSILKLFYEGVDESEYIDLEHLWSLIPASVLSCGFLIGFDPLIMGVSSITQSDPLMSILVLSLQGLVAGLVTFFIYEVGNQSFQVRNSMQTKENALLIVIAVMLGVGSGVEIVVPAVINRLPYTGLQITGAILAIGFYYVHALVDDWILENEWPHLLSAVMIFVIPFI